MAVRASNLASTDLPLERRQCHSPPRHRNDVPSLSAHVVELENEQVADPAVHTRGIRKCPSNQLHIPFLSTEQVSARLDPARVGSPRPATPLRRTPSMAVHAHHLASRDLLAEPADRPSVREQSAKGCRLRLDMIELEDEDICLVAVTTRMRCEVLIDEPSTRNLATPTTVSNHPLLDLSASPEVGGETLLAPMLPSHARMATEAVDRDQ
jgi:hypothetical protein